ncbi:MAG: hypothetical protein IJT95_02225, partial [Abditibacteriota bacterium]|nr:hypothetical protein [Abditibacteriota bacterium]
FNADRLGYVVDDKNRPLVFSQGDSFHLDKAAFKAENNTDLSAFGYGVSVEKYGYSGSGPIGNVNPLSNEYVVNPGNDVTYGDTLSVINSEIVTATWTISFDTIRSKHKVYTLGGSLTGANNFHTLIDLGCEAAKGLDSTTQQNEIYSRIFSKFATRDIHRIDSPNAITYWGPGASNTLTISDMLANQTGRCGNWSEFFIETCALQGVSVGQKAFYANQLDDIFFYALYQLGSFQGDSNPHTALFKDHVINTFGGKYYDVTNGSGPYDSLEAYLVNNIQIEKHLIRGHNIFGLPIIDPEPYGDRISLTVNTCSYYIDMEH